MRRIGRLVLAGVALVVAVSGCTQAGPSSQVTTPTPAGVSSPAAQPTPTRAPYEPTAQPATIDTTGVRMPLALEEAGVVDPEWTSLPLELDGLLVGPAERDGLVVFTAIRVDGVALWTVQRPLGAGFTLTRTSQGDPLAVITDTAEGTSTTTATAYRLDTGEFVWGPVDVPGPLAGAGTVFSANRDDDAVAAVAIDPDTGSPLSWAGGANRRILGEFEGAVLVEAEGRVALRDAHDGAVRWAVTNPTWDGTATLATARAPRGGLLIVEDGDGTRTLLRLDTGQVIAEGLVDAVIDPTTSAVVAAYPDGLRAMDLEGAPLWAYPTEENPVLHSARGALLYTRAGPSMRVHNIVTGAVAVAYEDSGDVIAVPEQFFTTGAAVITVDGRLLLATAPY